MARGKHSADGGSFWDSIPSKKDDYEEKRYYRDDSYEEDYDDDDEPDYAAKVKVICVIVAVIVIIVAAVLIAKNGIGKKTENTLDENTVEEEPVMEDTYQGYNVLGKIKIEKIGVEQFILDSKDEEALKNGVSKLYGGPLNNYGNLCLAGHNFDEMFGKLNELDIGDPIVLIEKTNDNKLVETTYEVKQILPVDPTDLTPLIPNEDKVELTLITCKDGSTERLVIKAEEKK